VARNRHRGADFEWQNLQHTALEHPLRLVPGVCAVLSNPLTRSLLIRFDPPQGAKERALRLIEHRAQPVPEADSGSLTPQTG
jgi:hypothetical protein